jgi:hypothetical protein
MYKLFILTIVLEVIIGTVFLGNKWVPKNLQVFLGVIAVFCLVFQLFYFVSGG